MAAWVPSERIRLRVQLFASADVVAGVAGMVSAASHTLDPDPGRRMLPEPNLGCTACTVGTVTAVSAVGEAMPDCPDIQGVDVNGVVVPEGTADCTAVVAGQLPGAGSECTVCWALLAVGDDTQLLDSSAIAVRRGCCFMLLRKGNISTGPDGAADGSVAVCP